MDVSIIIVNYNTRSLTLEAIESVVDKTHGVDYEIILVDNASHDGSVEYIKSSGVGDKIKIVALEANIGFGGANNRGVEVAEGRNIFLLNSDTLLINNAVKILSDELDANPDYGVVGGNLYDLDHNLIHSHAMVRPGLLKELDGLLFGMLRHIMGRSYEANHTSSNLDVAYVTGADLMISRELFVELGGFNPLFFMYYEETELCYRVKRRGLRIVNIPKSEIIHLEGGSFESKVSQAKFERVVTSRRIYYRLTYPRVVAALFDGILFMALAERLVIRFVMGNMGECRVMWGRLKVLCGIKVAN